MFSFPKAMTGLLFVVSSTVFAQAPQVPEIAARSYLLLDVTANQI